MRTIYPPYRTRVSELFFIVFLALFIMGCSGYQSVSYYSDGIYGEVNQPQQPQEIASQSQSSQQSGSYYKSYFAEKASQGIQDDYIFTDPEDYQTPMPEETSVGNYQAHGSWGDQVDRINVNIIYTRPFGWNWGYGWYDAPYTFGRASFWGYNYHPWYFSGHHHNPYYNPYRWGYRNPYWNRWDSWGYYNPYIDRYYNRSALRNAPIYSRLNGSRTISRNYTPSRSASGVDRASNVTTNRTRARSTTRTTSNSDTQRNGRSTTTQKREGVTTRNQTPSRTTTRRNNSDSTRENTSQSRNNSYNANRNYSNNRSTSRNNSSEYKSSSSSNSNYRSSTPTRTTNSSSRSSSSSSRSSSRRR